MVYNRLAEQDDVAVRWEESHVKHSLGPIFFILGLLLLSFVHAAANTPPVASFEVYASADGAPMTLVLDATASHDADGTIVAYQWIYGDGTSGSGAITTHTFPATETYTITLLVRDNQGASHLASRSVNVSQVLAPRMPSAEPTPTAIAVPINVPVGIRVGQRAPAFALLNQAGKTIHLSDFLGHVVLVEFWSSGCSACQAAMPHLESLRAAFADRGLVVITITVNRNVDGEWQYLAQSGFTKFVSLREMDPVARPVKETYGVTAIPHAFLIDRQGVIFFTGHINYVQHDMIESLL
jgi:peroxiredoxin